MVYVSFLRGFVRTDRTNRRYQQALAGFLEFCRRQGLGTRSAAAVDSALQRYFDGLFRERGGRGKSVAATTLAAVHARRPLLRGHLLGAQEALRGWARKVPGRSYPPLTRELTVAIAVWLARHGEAEAGAAVLLSFSALLRISEAAALRVRHVALPGDRRLDNDAAAGAVVRFRRAKGGREQSVTIEAPEAVQALRFLVRSARRAGRRLLVGLTAPQLRARFKQACKGLGIATNDYVWHSIRHGGATWLYLRGVDFRRIKLQGRWKSARSAEIYVQRGRAILLAQRVPRALARTAKLMASDPFRWFRAACRAASTA